VFMHEANTVLFLQFLSLSFTIMELMLFTCARSIHINTDRKELKQVLHFRFSFEPRFSEVDKSLFLAPPLRTTSCNLHYSGPILYDNERETWSKSNTVLECVYRPIL
jgi:hypothetical protein